MEYNGPSAVSKGAEVRRNHGQLVQRPGEGIPIADALEIGNETAKIGHDIATGCSSRKNEAKRDC